MSRSQEALVTLGTDVPSFVGRALRNLAGVQVVEGAPGTSIVRRGQSQALRVTVLDIAELDESLSDAPTLVGGGPALLAIEGVLDDRTAARLEDLAVSFADVDGRAWITGSPRTSRANFRKGQGRQLRPESLRLAQLLADYPGQSWTQRALATRGASTQVTAQRLLRRLEDEGLIVREGVGRATERTVADSRAMRRWLLAHGQPGTTARLPVYVRDDANLSSRLEEVSLAMTGSAAAERLGVPVKSGRTVTTYRADCEAERLEDIPSLLGGFRTDSGANVMLVADPMRLAHIDARLLEGDTLVASPSRVMLDLLLEARGVAAAEIFADLWRDDR